MRSHWHDWSFTPRFSRFARPRQAKMNGVGRVDSAYRVGRYFDTRGQVETDGQRVEHVVSCNTVRGSRSWQWTHDRLAATTRGNRLRRSLWSVARIGVRQSGRDRDSMANSHEFPVTIAAAGHTSIAARTSPVTSSLSIGCRVLRARPRWNSKCSGATAMHRPAPMHDFVTVTLMVISDMFDFILW